MKSSSFAVLIILSFLFSGCQFFHSTDQLTVDASSDSAGIRTIYIQSFSGQNFEQVQEVFFKTVSNQDRFRFVELLPDNYQHLKILRIEVTDYSLWDSDEPLELDVSKPVSTGKIPDLVIRRNALVGFKVSLYEAETGRLLLRKPYSQPFQQIYLGADEIKGIPDRSQELERLTKILVTKLLNDFSISETDSRELELEIGYGYDWISKYFYNFGDGRIKKANRLARAGDYEKAIWIWQLVLFRAGENEPIDIYKKNRAVAYYNLGNVYKKLGDQLKAAEMYSMANRMEQTQKYAQAWGDTMLKWLDDQKATIDQVNTLSREKSIVTNEIKPGNATQLMPVENQISEADLLRSIEHNDQLLLKARELWPLEPALKFTETPEKIPLNEENPNMLIDESVPESSGSEFMKPAEGGNMEPDNQLIKKVPDVN